MANICGFSMMVRGNRNNIEAFYNAMRQKGKVWMGRGANAEIEYEDVSNRAFINGDCKWSIRSALVDNAISMQTDPTGWYFGEGVDGSEFEFITLFEACKKWNLNMEVYSEECGCEFQEHYVFVDGDLICDDCVDYSEYNISEFDIKEEAEEELGITITDEEWENKDMDEWISRGGFENWDFEI